MQKQDVFFFQRNIATLITSKKKFTMSTQTFVGPVIHSKGLDELIIHENVQVDVKDGKIEKFILNPNPSNINRENVKYLKKGHFIIPGFIDAHIHAPQLPNIGLGYDKCLLDWLKAYTYPHEKKYSDVEFADKVYDAVVGRTLKLGTTTACYFASLHRPASLILAKKVVKYGQRALVGKVNMNSCLLDGCSESREISMKETKAFIEDVEKLNSFLVQPIITPRYGSSCDMQLMKMLGDLAREKNYHIQTHISEIREEADIVKANFGKHPSMAAVYDAAGLLTNKTVLAHGIHLSDNDLDIIYEHKSAIIHCPTANTYLKSGLCDVRRLQAANVTVGLGTDISGGNSASVLDVMRAALQVSIHLSFSKSNYNPLNYKNVFYMATLGGAQALHMDNTIGNFELGKEFDALIIDVAASGSALDNLQDYTLEEYLQRYIHSGDDRNIVEVYVSGKRVV